MIVGQGDRDAPVEPGFSDQASCGVGLDRRNSEAVYFDLQGAGNGDGRTTNTTTRVENPIPGRHSRPLGQTDRRVGRIFSAVRVPLEKPSLESVPEPVEKRFSPAIVEIYDRLSM